MHISCRFTDFTFYAINVKTGSMERRWGSRATLSKLEREWPGKLSEGNVWGQIVWEEYLGGTPRELWIPMQDHILFVRGYDSGNLG